MNLTLALVVGVAVLLPGLTALVFWNLRAGPRPARGPELSLTSTSALFTLLAVSLALHAVGLVVTAVVWSAATDLGQRLPASLTSPLLPQPYTVALDALAHPGVPIPLSGLVEMLAVIGALSAFAAFLTTNSGLDVLLDGVDVAGQGWVYRAIVRPAQQGYTPFAYVLTTPVQGSLGLGYQGVIVDIRQGAGGQVTAIALAEPEAFSYELHAPADTNPEPLRNGARRALDGVLVIDGASIRNILVRSVPESFVDAIADVGGDTIG